MLCRTLRQLQALFTIGRISSCELSIPCRNLTDFSACVGTAYRSIRPGERPCSSACLLGTQCAHRRRSLRPAASQRIHSPGEAFQPAVAGAGAVTPCDGHVSSAVAAGALTACSVLTSIIIPCAYTTQGLHNTELRYNRVYHLCVTLSNLLLAQPVLQLASSARPPWVDL